MLVAWIVVSGGRFRTGGVVSRTVIVNVAWDELRCRSVDVQTTVVTPSGKVRALGAARGAWSVGATTAGAVAV